MLSGEAEPLLDDFAVTGTSLLIATEAQLARVSPSTHPRARREFKDGRRARPFPPHTRGRDGARQRSGEVVEAGHVFAGDLAAHARRDLGEVLVEHALRVGPDAIGVRVVGAPNDVVLADQRDDRVEILVLLIGDIALPAEIVARLELEIEAPRAVGIFGVEAVEDIRQPRPPDSPSTKLKSGYFSQAPDASSETSTSIVSSWKRAERTSRHWVKYCFSISGVSGARNALKPVEWNRALGRRGFPCR